MVCGAGGTSLHVGGEDGGDNCFLSEPFYLSTMSKNETLD